MNAASLRRLGVRVGLVLPVRGPRPPEGWSWRRTFGGSWALTVTTRPTASQDLSHTHWFSPTKPDERDRGTTTYVEGIRQIETPMRALRAARAATALRGQPPRLGARERRMLDLLIEARAIVRENASGYQVWLEECDALFRETP